jgi:hypothetical protein
VSSPALDAPARNKTEAQLDIAMRALILIANESYEKFAREKAQSTIARIRAIQTA